jgi:hypothetical protein
LKAWANFGLVHKSLWNSFGGNTISQLSASFAVIEMPNKAQKVTHLKFTLFITFFLASALTYGLFSLPTLLKVNL